jgi:hypothetical protein
MALSAPTPLFERLVAVWRSLELRSDTDDIIRELLGQFSLEKVYASSADTDAFLQLVTALVVKLEAIFYIQRLTLPTDNAQASRYLGLLASWEVTVRTVDFVLHTLLDGRHLLVEPHLLLHRYVPSFLLLALRVLALHPRQPAGQRGTRERRERFARIHTAVEQVAGRSSSSASATLQVCKELTARLCASDPAASGLPHGLKYGLPSLAADMVRTALPADQTCKLIPLSADSAPRVPVPSLHIGARPARRGRRQLAGPVSRPARCRLLRRRRLDTARGTQTDARTSPSRRSRGVEGCCAGSCGELAPAARPD